MQEFYNLVPLLAILHYDFNGVLIEVLMLLVLAIIPILIFILISQECHVPMIAYYC